MSDSTQAAGVDAGTAGSPPWPRITVIIPCYNAERFIGETIRSALDQTYPPLEVIVVDDGSCDGSAEVAKSIGASVRVFRQANQGPSVARNFGVSEARGDWIAFLDADDLWEPAKLERQASAAASNPSAACVFTDLYYLREDRSRTVRPAPVEILEGEFQVKMFRNWALNPSCAMVPADVARKVHFPAGVSNGEDVQYFIQLRAKGPFVHVPEALTGYRQRPGQLTAEPDHGLKSIPAHLAFIQAHPELYRPEHVEQVRVHFGEALLDAHEVAYWARNNDVARRCRELYYKVHPKPLPNPPGFDRTLYPWWLTGIKDVIDRAWGRLTWKGSVTGL